MNNQYIWSPLKRSLKPPESISAFWPMIRNIKWVFTLLTFWFCKNCKILCDSRHNFSNTTYTASRNSSCFSTKIYIWTCWDVGVDIPNLFWPQQLPWQSSSNSYINKTLDRLVMKLHNREIIGCGVTIQLCDKDCSVGSDEHVVSLAMEATKFSVLQVIYTVS